MSLDREQVRRDIRGFATRDEVAAHCLALLAELEQAERERDVARRGMKAVSKAKSDVEARFARVPALVEALKETQAVLSSFQPMSYTQRNNRVASIVHRALLAWESE